MNKVMPTPKQKPAGFSLIELMFTIVFMSVIVLGVVKLQTSNLALGHSQALRLQADFWANNGIEIVKSIGLAGLSCSPGPCSQKISALTPYTLGAAGPASEGLIEEIFDRTIVLEPLSSGAVFRVTARIEWTDSTGEHLCDAARRLSGCVEVKSLIYE